MSQMKKNNAETTQLTARQKEILLLLTQFDGANPVTVSAISEKFKLSTRTVLRELPQIEKWVTAQGFSFIRKPGVGLLLDESLENRQWMLQLLNLEEVEKSYHKDERRKLIIGELLSSKEPLKFLYFTSKYKISEGTLSSDLDFVEQWLLQYQIVLVRKPGVGIFLQGAEEHIRQAVANAVYEFMNEEEILSLLRAHTDEKTETHGADAFANNRLSQYVGKETIKAVKEILSAVEQKFHIKYSDSGYMAMMVHLSLAVHRIQKKENINMNAEELAELQQVTEYAIAEEIGNRLEKAFSLQVPEGELGFITMHLVGAEVWMQDEDIAIHWDKVHIKRLAIGMVGVVEKELQVSLYQDELLMTDLTQCIEPILRRLSLGIYIRNAYSKEMQQNYPDVYEATEKACSLLLIATGVEQIPETEVGLLTMHFCAAVGRAKAKTTAVSVALVCPTGIGTSRMLDVNLGKTFPQLQVDEILSARQIVVEELHQKGIDLIVSTVQLDIDFPYICVSPMLLEQDKLLLKNKLSEIQVKNKTVPKEIEEKPLPRATIGEITQIGEDILHLLETVVLYPVHSISYKQELVAKAAYIFAESVEAEETIKADLLARERISATYIAEYNIVLLHCATEGVVSPKFGYIRMMHSLYADGHEICGAVVMLVPKTENKSCIEIMGHISTLLMESPELYYILKDQEEKDIIAKLEVELGKFYKRQLKRRMEW
ncbi:BglG family transcription antiterminator [Chakrabartyella piscis]|uniref:BglG family transcription antiterminator n=1 Tax=Chakrabartyella piscis TaxID=2918914 RepID=UPI002958A568|nr:BglG family transcription antiterminator [Chakrabartyella piscis]